MKISFLGACREVTGSCILVETENKKFLVDCGLFQDNESRFKNYLSFKVNPFDIDFVLLTHAHIDHCGRIPKLFKNGFMGKVYCSPATVDLANQMLLDSAKVFSFDRCNAPIYYASDVEIAIDNFEGIQYGKDYAIDKDIRIRLSDAGHILGSAIFEVWIKENGIEKKLVFSGDLGNPPAPIVKDTEFIDSADFVFIESTYGDKIHVSREEGRKLLKENILESIKSKGVLIMPVFALERAQEMVLELKMLFESENILNMPVLLDSPLASRVTNIYKQYSNYFDEESKKLFNKKKDIFYFNNFKIAKKRGDQDMFFKYKGPKLIMAGSGMCEGGRIMNYLKKYLPIKNTKLLIIAFQAEDSLGRRLLEGEKEVEIDRKKIKVGANVVKVQTFSSHADSVKLVKWLSCFKKKPNIVFIGHGEEDSSLALSKKIKNDLGLNTIVPEYDKEYEL